MGITSDILAPAQIARFAPVGDHRVSISEEWAYMCIPKDWGRFFRTGELRPMADTRREERGWRRGCWRSG